MPICGNLSIIAQFIDLLDRNRFVIPISDGYIEISDEIKLRRIYRNSLYGEYETVNITISNNDDFKMIFDYYPSHQNYDVSIVNPPAKYDKEYIDNMIINVLEFSFAYIEEYILYSMKEEYAKASGY